MNRRAFVTGLGAVLAAPLAAEAQPPAKIPRVGFLSPSSVSDPRTSRYFQAFRQGLRDAGWAEGQNIVIESRWAEGKYNRLPALAAELVRLEVAVIVTYGGAATQATRQATRTIPIVMAVVQEAVSTGLVSSLAHPGGNITGTSSMSPELVQKELQILKELVPKVSRIALLGNPAQPGHGPQLRHAQDAARELGVSVRVLEARDPSEIDKAFAVMTAERASAVVVLPDSMLLDHRTRIANLAIQGRLPMVSAIADHAEAGGLLAYGPSIVDTFHRAATYVDRILKGAKPGDLPVEQPTKFELIINLKTAKALGLTIPSSLLLRADQVIE
jgi:putative tryptophan/tyrosine transport system substrate-binding protein